MRNKKLLLIAAVAVMLVGTTSAYGYWEVWNGWFNSGTLTYNDTTYTIVGGSCLTVDDYTLDPPSDRDTFGIWIQIPRIAFVCVAGSGDSIFVYIATVTGGKEYGTSGTKEGEGYWDGDGSQRNEYGQLVKIFDFWGTWASTGNHFDYTMCPPCPPRTPTYTADWDVTGSYPDGITGGGTCSGKRTYYED